MNINERIENIIKDHYSGNKRSFAKAVGVSATVIENIVGSRKGKPSYDVLEKMCANANISPDWLLTGSGSMLRTGRDSNIVNGENKGIVGNYGTIGNVGDNTGIGQMSGGCVHDNEINNYHGLTRDDLVTMMEERFQHMLKKEEDIRNIFEENRKLTDEMLRQNDEFRRKNDDYREAVIHIKALMERINQLTDKLINNQ